MSEQEEETFRRILKKIRDDLEDAAFLLGPKGLQSVQERKSLTRMPPILEDLVRDLDDTICNDIV